MGAWNSLVLLVVVIFIIHSHESSNIAIEIVMTANPHHHHCGVSFRFSFSSKKFGILFALASLCVEITLPRQTREFRPMIIVEAKV
jgi:hypothetical protein